MKKIKFIENIPLSLRSHYDSINVAFHTQNCEFHTVHCHDYWEFLIAIDGTICNNINGKEYKMHRNDVFLIRPNDSHCIKSVASPFSYHNIMVKDEYACRIFQTIKPELYQRIISGKEFFCTFLESEMNIINNHISNMHHISSEDIFAISCMQNLASVHIICLFLNHILNIETKQPEWLTIIESYIKSQTVLKISVADLCAITNYSKTHLNRLFRSFYDMTTLEYIVGKKINYASRMLECTDYTIDYISEMAGFSSKGHFIKLFKQKYNTTPGRYRKQVNVYANIK